MHPEDLRTMLLHPFLTLTLSHIAKSTSKHVGHAVGDAFDSLVLSGVKYSDMKKNPERVAEEIISAARERGIPVKEDDKERIVVAVKKAAKVIDKLTEDISEEKLDVLYQALAEKTDDPIYVLKRNEIDIEPELEEFRQFLAEISGKKIAPKKGAGTGKAVVKKAEKLNVKGILDNAKLEVLSVLNGLEFAGYSGEAKAKAIEKLSARIAELSKKELTPDNLQTIGLYAFALEMIKAGNFERVKEVEKL